MEFFTLVVTILLGLIAYAYVKGRPKARSPITKKKVVLGKNRKKKPANAFWSGKEWLQERRTGRLRRYNHERRRFVRVEEDRRMGRGYDRRGAINAWDSSLHIKQVNSVWR